MQRWAMFIAGFDYKLVHIKGAQNYLADYLFRNPNLVDMSADIGKSNSSAQKKMSTIFLMSKKFKMKRRTTKFFIG